MEVLCEMMSVLSFAEEYGKAFTDMEILKLAFICPIAPEKFLRPSRL